MHQKLFSFDWLTWKCGWCISESQALHEELKMQDWTEESLPTRRLHSNKGWHCREKWTDTKGMIFENWRLERCVSLRWGCLSWSLNKKNPQIEERWENPTQKQQELTYRGPESRNTCMSHKTRTDRQGCHILSKGRGRNRWGWKRQAQATPVKAF